MNTLGKRIAAIRGNESRDDFASKYDVHRNTLAKWEGDTAIPSSSILHKMEKDACVPTGWLLNGFTPTQNICPPLNEEPAPIPEEQKPPISAATETGEALELHREMRELEKEMRSLLKENADLRVSNERLHHALEIAMGTAEVGVVKQEDMATAG